MNVARRRWPAIVGAGAALAAVGLAPSQANAVSTEVPVQVIVALKPTAPVNDVAAVVARATGGKVGYRYTHALRGFSITVPARALAGIARRPDVEFVEPVTRQRSDAQSVPTGVRRIFADTNAAIGIDGLDDKRVDVDVAVIDTGVDLQQPDLNVVGGVNCVVQSGACVAGGDDDQGHGTHVAGTIGALDNNDSVVGVAPGARLWAVKVLDATGSGTSAQVVAGIDWVAAHADTIEVANMSLGGAGFSRAEYQAIQSAVNVGVAFAVAAGNSAADAAGYSPGGFDNVMSVSALADFDGRPGGLGSPTCRSDVDETNADFSNYGTSVDLAAPGVCILSTYPVEKGGQALLSGTSMASPHAAGALALLASSGRARTATQVQGLYDAVTSAGNHDWTDQSPDGVNEPLLDVHSFTPTLISSTVNPPSTTVSYSGSATQVNRTTWRATVTATATAGTTVTGRWSSGNGGGCTVAVGASSCAFSTNVSKRVSSVTWTASSGTVVTIKRP